MGFKLGRTEEALTAHGGLEKEEGLMALIGRETIPDASTAVLKRIL